MLPDEALGDAGSSLRRNSLHTAQVPTPDAYTATASNLRGENDRNSPTLARTIGNVAARAGTAILPPTLVKEINASRQASFNINRSTSSSPMQSPSDSRLLLSRSTSLQGDVHDPPPIYNRTSSANSTSSLRTPEEDVNSYSAPHTVSTTEWPSSHLENDAVPAAGVRNHQHPQSISAAGPSNRSILHASGRQEARNQSSSTTCAGVRFDPQAINAALQQNATSSQVFPTNPYFPTVEGGFHSEASSGRPSFHSGKSHLHHHNQQQAPSSSLTKGKGKANGPSSSPGTGPGVKKGIKGLLGNLLKEDEDRSQLGLTQTSSNNASPPNLEEDDSSSLDYKEFRKGTYTFPFSIPLPSNLPPTLHADFGSNTYVVRAHVHRAGPLTSNLTADKEITLVHAPDEDGQDDNEAIIVERNWEDCLRYIVVVTGKSFPVGCSIPVWIKFVPTEKVRIHRIVASLEERTAYFAKGRRIARHEVPRKWNLLKVAPKDAASKEGILPIVSKVGDSQVIELLTPLAQAAAQSSDNAADWQGDSALASLMDPFGPWELAMDLPVPTSGTSIINISTNHKKSNIAVSHLVKLAIRVEKVQGNGDERKLYDILIEAPVTINHSHTANAWLSLPDYWSVGQDQRQSSVSQAAAISPPIQRENTTANRRQTAPSLTPRRTTSGSNRSNDAIESPSSTIPAPPLQGRINDNLIQLSQQWLNLSASTHLPANQVVVTPMTTQEPEEITGLPTYAMIDNARGSVDLPRSRSGGTSVK